MNPTVQPARSGWSLRPEPAGAARRRAVLTVLWIAVVNAVLAWFGAIGLVLGRLSLGPELDARLPWGSRPLAGVALAAAVAAPLTLLTALAARDDRRTLAVAVICGALLIGWIVLQMFVLRALSWFHPVYLLIGLWLVALGLHLRTLPRRHR